MAFAVFITPLWLDSVIATPLDYALARTEGGKLALVPHNIQAGDGMALSASSRCPFVVRRGMKACGSLWEILMSLGLWKRGMGEDNVWEMEFA